MYVSKTKMTNKKHFVYNLLDTGDEVQNEINIFR